MAQQQQAYNIFASPVAPIDDARKKFMKKKNGQFCILKEFKKDSHLKKILGFETDDEAYEQWFETNHKYGFNYNSYALLDALRYSGIWESLLLNCYMQPVAYCSTQPAFYPKQEDFPLIDKIGKEELPELTVFGKKYIRAAEETDIGVWVGTSAKVEGQDGPTELLGFARCFTKELPQWKEGWAAGQAVYAPTLIVRTYNAGTNVKDIPESISKAIIGHGVGWTAEAKFRFQPPTLFQMMAHISTKFTIES